MHVEKGCLPDIPGFSLTSLSPRSLSHGTNDSQITTPSKSALMYYVCTRY